MAETQRTEIDALARAIDVRSLRILVAIDQAGSISAAARSLGFSQPTITQHVQRLEERLGASLVSRTGRAARLTPVGALLARHAPRIDASLTAAATELSRVLGRRAGLVRLVALPESVGSVLAPAASRLAALLPHLDIEVLEAATPEDAMDMVQDGRADIAVTPTPLIARDRSTSARREGLRTTFLFSEEVIALTSADVPSAAGRVDASALVDLPWILGAGTCAAAIADRLGRAQGAADSSVSRADAAVALAAHGRGTALVTESAIAGSRLPAGLNAFGLAPAVRRRMVATTLVEAATIPAVSAALRVLASRRPAVAEVEAVLDARRRSAGHRARFASLAAVDPAPTHPEENDDMSLTNTGAMARVAAVSAAGAIALAACSGPSESDTEASASSSASSATAAIGTDTGEEIDSITVTLPGSLSSLYVGSESGILNYYVASIVQEGLLTVDADGALQPGLAESWEQTDDVTYVFELRDDAYFQDGNPVTAEDVVFSLDMARDETASPGLAYYMTNIDTVEQTGDNEVTITLAEPDAAFAGNMTTAGAAFITEKSFWEENDGDVGTSDSLLMGSGPYEVTEFVPDDHATFERVDTWWGDLPSVKEIRIDFVSDESTRLLAAQSGDVDIAFNVPFSQAEQWESIEDMRVLYENDLSYVGLYFNLDVAPFDDPKVREAIAHAVNREAYVDTLLDGHGEVATAIMTPESLTSVYSADEAREILGGIPQYDYDLDAAAEALAESDYPDGFDAEILTPNTGPQLGTAAQALSQDLATIGINLTVTEVPIEEWLASLDPSSGYGLNYMWYFSTLGDPAEIPSYLIGADNPAAYDNEEILDLLSQVGAETDPATRIDLLVEAETLQAEDVVNIPLWWGQSATAFSNDLGLTDYSAFTFVSTWPSQLYAASSE
ncbi:ABC transporter substrate-binding protein [Demequina salsinemoris]|uniref:ABC transporter substrate-binding protein n=1 Tax=Demequina salsinemoris TaxID=577470 RepID=UPI0007808E6D|nr:ABC transporter substrate-binding protein [Demequina salsinemoris]